MDGLAAIKANIKYYANIVAEKSTLRRLIKINEEIANTCYVGKESLEGFKKNAVLPAVKIFPGYNFRSNDNRFPVHNHRKLSRSATDTQEIMCCRKNWVRKQIQRT